MVWRVDEDSPVNVARQVHAWLTRHETQIVDVLALDAERTVVTSDADGVCAVWALPALELTQVFTVASPLPATALTAFPANPALGVPPVLVVGRHAASFYQFTKRWVKEPVVFVQYNAKFRTFVLAAAKRVSVWDARNGKLKLQVLFFSYSCLFSSFLVSYLPVGRVVC